VKVMFRISNRRNGSLTSLVALHKLDLTSTTHRILVKEAIMASKSDTIKRPSEESRTESGGRRLGRREFLKSAAATGAGWTIVKPGSVYGTEANSRLELGVIGSGGRGRFIAGLFEKNSNTKVVALHDYFADRVDQLGERLQVESERRYTGLDGYRRLLDGKLDAVAIESPPYFHPEQAIAALDAGKHVYLAKPIAVDVAGCLAILDAAGKARGKRSILVDFQTRNDPLFREAASRVHQGDIGTPVLGHVYYHAGRLKPQAQGTSQAARLRNWVFDKALSGDIIVEQNIHVIDVANWYLQSHPIKAQGFGGRKARVDVGDCWDHYVVTYLYPNEVVVDFSSAQFTKGYDDLCIRLYGGSGTVDSHYDGDVRIRGDKPWDGGSTKGLYTSGAVNNIKDFYASVAGGNYLFDTVAPSVESNLAAILGRMAAYEGRAVTWNEMLKSRQRIDARLQGL
jgi:predicted dehydrogenase